MPARRITKRQQEQARKDSKEIASEETRGRIAVQLAGPDPVLVDIARKEGVSVDFVRGVRDQLRTEAPQVGMQIRKLTAKNALAKIETILDMSFERLYELIPKANLANLRDVAYVADRLFNMRQLIRGEPTAITTVDDRRKLNELLPLVLKEAARRGVTIEGTARLVNTDEPQRGLPDSRVIAHESQDPDDDDAGHDAAPGGVDVASSSPPADAPADADGALRMNQASMAASPPSHAAEATCKAGTAPESLEEATT
ncbi:MAG: hypothetical protein AB7Q01_14145 [Gammaproteobacteria bacterium]